MNPDEALTTTENVLRDLVDEVMTKAHGAAWIDEIVSDEVRDKWQARFNEERSRRKAAKVEERRLYYSELSELANILYANWQHFAKCLGSRKRMEPDMKRLIAYRHAQKHGRELLPYEVQLLLGITGELRNKVTVYRSEERGGAEVFPRIEQIVDSFGNVARGSDRVVDTGLVLHPGDEVTFACTGWDPKGERLQWNWSVHATMAELGEFAPDDTVVWRVTEPDIAERQIMHIFLVSTRPFHRRGWYDDVATFRYSVLPRSLDS